MELDHQLKILIEDAAKHGIAPIVMEKAIAPVMKSLAIQLKHLEYYVLQNLQEDWIISVISDRQSPMLEKKVIYAFSTVQDAKNSRMSKDVNLVAIALPTIQILFRVFSMQQIDSIIFFPQSGNITQGIEVKRHDLQNIIQQQLRQLKTIPPDIA
ncbi:conserved hypothetical protein [Hyella patelloides LEGE 07179]|uniref:Uncharacterized protein n=1 Tax=Hyella patelloides LEGE 07179 TaxID=945734 RepID=A0A563VWT3_9CYAN|nr:hypothetical protein [Hyella patelloides]VEP15713.1 conserved hypothetical protein [Hyella patelloides LEGE 07179]